MNEHLVSTDERPAATDTAGLRKIAANEARRSPTRRTMRATSAATTTKNSAIDSTHPTMATDVVMWVPSAHGSVHGSGARYAQVGTVINRQD